MKQLFYFLIIIFTSINSFCQANYSGFIDKYPIELVTHVYSDTDVHGIYVYTAFDEPIVLQGAVDKGTLFLFEKDKKGTKSASLSFDKFDSQNEKLEGIWTNLITKKQLKIILTKNNESENGIIQPVTTKDNYFRIVTDFSTVTQVRIFQKKTDKLLQKIDVACQFWGLNNISTGDYNFDGITDFSIFESSYAGPNTSSLYFLYNPKTKKYFDSGFLGVSLEFDSKTKRIIERNQCCAGSIVTTATYKVVKNKMILEKEKCYKWDEKKQALTERKISECR